MAIRAGRVGPRLLGQVLLPSPTSRTSCCPRRAPGWHSWGHRGRRAGTRSEGCRSVQWGHCATRCALGGGCSPQVPQGSRQSKLTFLQHPKPEPVFLKLFAPCSPEEFKDRSAAEQLHLCSFALGPAQSRSTRTRSCARGTARVPRCSQRLPSGRTRHTPGLGTGTNRTIFGDGLEPDPTLLRLPTAPHELGVFVPSRLISAARCVPAFRDTQAHAASAFAAQPFS